MFSIKNKSLALILDYFGGCNVKTTSLFSFFYEGEHEDLGYDD